MIFEGHSAQNIASKGIFELEILEINLHTGTYFSLSEIRLGKQLPNILL